MNETYQCPECRKGVRRPGRASKTFTRDGVTVTITNIPALVCDACGEPYFEGPVADSVVAAGRALFALAADLGVTSIVVESGEAPASVPERKAS